MTIRSTTSFAPTLEGYDPPEQQVQRDRMAAQMRKMPRVDHNGHVVKAPDPVVETVTPTPIRPMALALAEIATTLDVDLSALLSSSAFRAEIATISPSDAEALTEAVRFHNTPAPATPSMQPNPAQGSIGGSVASSGSGATLAVRMRQNTDKLLGQPEPPGSTYRR